MMNNYTKQPLIWEKFNLTAKVAVVTGGAGLLGAEFCRTLAEAGASVVIADLNISSAQDLGEELINHGSAALAVETDVGDLSSVQKMVAAALDTFDRLDILINSAALDPKF
ncbi:MAG TPA: SDR family NAD(P)-dependent oxidoreductase, partial [Anaerolineales bacterium]|nr:SDR family NAD(P)-dependent oxidoreductase [Anaerolineales bacterium]